MAEEKNQTDVKVANEFTSNFLRIGNCIVLSVGNEKDHTTGLMIALWSDWLRLVVLAGFVESLAQHQQAVDSMASSFLSKF